VGGDDTSTNSYHAGLFEKNPGSPGTVTRQDKCCWRAYYASCMLPEAFPFSQLSSPNPETTPLSRETSIAHLSPEPLGSIA
jgi:hypothetical protein